MTPEDSAAIRRIVHEEARRQLVVVFIWMLVAVVWIIAALYTSKVHAAPTPTPDSSPIKAYSFAIDCDSSEHMDSHWRWKFCPEGQRGTWRPPVVPTPTPIRKPWLAGHPLPVIPMRTKPCPKPEMTVYMKGGKAITGCKPFTMERSGGCPCVPDVSVRVKQ